MNISSWRNTLVLSLMLACAPSILLASIQTDESIVSTKALGDAGTLSAGQDHTCSITDLGSIKCWGSNDYGQLGNGNTTQSTMPVAVSGLSGATVVALGAYHSCALVAGGAVLCWGNNGNGQLGNGSTMTSTTPVAVSGLSGAIALAAGQIHSCVVMLNGAVQCWGKNSEGQLGNGTFASSSTPIMVSALSGATALALGRNHSCALVAGGEVRCWGKNGNGQLGNGNTATSTTPVAVSGLSGATSLALGRSHSCALVAEGKVQCWGYNGYGQLGNDSTAQSTTPVEVTGLTGATALALGDSHSCAIVSDGAMRCWGRNNFGQLGNGSTTQSTTPVAVTGLTGSTALALGYFHTCAVVAGGTVRCWGNNDRGQVGNGIESFYTLPQDVIGSPFITRYNLTYSAGNGGNISGASPQQVAHGGNGAEVTAVANTGYIFADWSDGASANPRTDTNVTSNISVTAEFSVQQYTVSFDSQGGSAVAAITQDFGSAVTVPGAPMRAGYTFANWNTASDGSGASYAPAATFAMPSNDLALFAIWTINQYAVSFDSKGGSAVASIIQDFASTVTVPAAPTRTGYNFANWNTVSDGSGTSYAPAATFSMPANNSTLFAIWTINQYTLTYTAGANGSITGTSPQTVIHGSAGSVVTAVADTGYSFVNWSDSSTANPRTDSNVTANVSVTANFAINQYTLTYTSGANGSITGTSPQTINHGSDGSSVTAVAATGYDFVDWSDGGVTNPRTDTNVTANITVTANFANDAPSISVVDDQTILEDSATTVLTVTLSDLETALVDLQLTAQSSSTALIAHPTIGTNANPGERTLSFALVSNGNGGPVTINLTATDSAAATFQRTFTITVTPVNDAPSLTLGTSPTHAAATTGAQSVSGFATVDLGPADEDATQSVADYLIDSVVDADGVLIANSLDIANNGTLSYTLSGIGGTATITVRVRDDGGTLNGGVNTSSPQQFTIHVVPGADLQIAKTNNRVSLLDGEVTVYAIVVANAGPNAVTGARLLDTLPSTLINGSWACVQASSTATCPVPDANNGNLDVLINIGTNQYLRFDVMAEVDGVLEAQVINTATVIVPDGVTALNAEDDSATDTDLIVPVGVFVNGFEDITRGALTVPGAEEALAD